jgi:hypothetical protein
MGAAQSLAAVIAETIAEDYETPADGDYGDAVDAEVDSFLERFRGELTREVKKQLALAHENGET